MMNAKLFHIHVVCMVLITGICAATVCADEQPLFAPVPHDRSMVDDDATLKCRLRSEPSSFNPILMFTAIDAQFEYLLWDRPFVLDKDLRWSINPDVVESFEFADDLLQATLKLKSSLRWQDGTPMTSADLVFSWQRILDDNVIARKAGHGTEQITQCEAINLQTIRFTFKEALATNKWSVDFPIIPKHIYEPLVRDDPTMQQSDACVQANRNPIGSGPYQISEWLSGERIVLSRWEGYPGPKPAFARIIFRVMPDNNAALLAFETGEIDEMSLAPQQFAADTDNQRFKDRGVKIRGEQWTNYYIGWNTRGPNAFLTEPAVRNAIGIAINRPLISERVFFGLFKESAGFYPASFTGRDTRRTSNNFDLEQAARMLDDAGWLVSGDDGWRYKKSSNGAEKVRAGFVLNLVAGSQTSPRVADIMRSDLRKIGVDMTTQTLEWSVFNERNLNHQFDAFLSAWTCGPDPDEARNLFHSDAAQSGRNYVGYQNPKVDALFDRGVHETDAGERARIYRTIEQTILSDEPYTFLVEAPTLWAFNHRLRGVSLSPRGPLHSYPGIRGWWTPKLPQPTDDGLRTGLPQSDAP
ncbi:MAG: ABC transporter substrate-binding protein [Phycisphaerae bacterium]|nr:hypothetical protein [Phycisphaerales bacterium]